MEYLDNTPTRTQVVLKALPDVPLPSIDVERPLAWLDRRAQAQRTPLVYSEHLAAQAGVAGFFVKDERGRMGLGSFKALGAAYVIAREAQAGDVSDRRYVAASAGNHGISVAAGAAAVGAQSTIYLSATVPEGFAEKLRGLGAEVRRAGDTYEQSMAIAEKEAAQNGWALLSDSSWPGYFERPHILMEGYLVLMKEAVDQMRVPPTHIFLQAGVGGLAAACAAWARAAWGDGPRIIVVEPQAAPALFASIHAGKPRVTEGPISAMGRLDCKEPSLIALKGLARDASGFMTISEAQGRAGQMASAQAGLPSTASGAAGVAGALALAQAADAPGLDGDARVLVILSEEATG